MTMKRVTVAVVIALVGSACSSSAETLPDLTEEFGCGYGFFVSNADQTVGLFIEYTDHALAPSGEALSTSQLNDEVWNAELRFGSDLFANWCDDVLEPGEPTPQVEETWDVSGTVTITESPDQAGCGLGSAGATLTELTADGPEGEIMELEDVDVVNEHWGCVAG